MVKRATSISAARQKSLDDIRVLDLTQTANGAYCTLLLSLLGAEVIKLEPPAAQSARSALAKDPSKDSVAFIQLNHGKKSVILSIEREAGRRIFKELAKKADVVVEDYPAGHVERLGIGYDVLKKINPRLIYSSNKGFSVTSPYRDYPAYDPVGQAMAGFMTVHGTEGDSPCKLGPAVGDWATGTFAALGILAALRLRDLTGTGRQLETSMHEALVSFTLDWQQVYLQWGVIPKPGTSSTSPPGTKMPRPVYQASDGYFMMFINTDEQWKTLLKIVGREDLLTDPRFENRTQRAQHASEVNLLIDDWAKGRTREEVLKAAGCAGVFTGPIFNVKEVLDDPFLNGAGFFKEIDHPQRGKTRVFGLPVKFSDSPTEPESSSPLLGEHSRKTYQDLLGFTDKEMADLHREGVI